MSFRLAVTYRPMRRVNIVQIADDGSLFGEGWEGYMSIGVLVSVNVLNSDEIAITLRKLSNACVLVN